MNHLYFKKREFRSEIGQVEIEDIPDFIILDVKKAF